MDFSRLLKRALLVALLALAALVFSFTLFHQANYYDNGISEMLFYTHNNGLRNFDIVVWQYIGQFWYVVILLAAALFAPLLWGPLRRRKLLYATVALTVAAGSLTASLGVPRYLINSMRTSQLYERNYVDPARVNLEFPATKRNLVMIYMESIENTVMSREAGGRATRSRMPELEKLALQNTNFTHRDDGLLGGSGKIRDTTWSLAGMTATLMGVGLHVQNLGVESNAMYKLADFLPGGYSLGEILEKNGYKQTFLLGASSKFGGLDRLMHQHGNHEIKDWEYLKRTGYVPKDYHVFWGIEDRKVFDYARGEATRLAATGKPFNLTIETADTHFPEGYLDPECGKPFKGKYDNAHRCSSAIISEYVQWVRSQPWGDNTTIVLLGDHLGMASDYYRAMVDSRGYERTIYNAIINPAVKPVRATGRQISPMDFYPTTLAALGVKIEGEKMGLGVNLFSGHKTLTEKLGGNRALNNQLERKSEYYLKKIATPRAGQPK